MSNTNYATDKEKVDDAMMRIERIMRLRGVSGYVVITSSRETNEHFRLNDDSFIKYKKHSDSMAFMVEMDSRKINPDQAMKTIEELSHAGESAKKVGLAIEQFINVFADRLKKKFS